VGNSKFGKPLCEATVLKSIQEVTTRKDVVGVLDKAQKFSNPTIDKVAGRLETAVKRPCFKGNQKKAINLIRETRLTARQ
jgi:hypothetical protein